MIRKYKWSYTNDTAARLQNSVDLSDDSPGIGNVLKNAPHTAEDIMAAEWDRPYTREQAAFPAPWVRERKFWPYVARVDNVWGDRNLFYRLQVTPEGPTFKATRVDGKAEMVASTDNWQFVQFINRVIAVQANTAPQSFDLTSSSLFADLAGAPPQARYIDIVGRFVKPSEDLA